MAAVTVTGTVGGVAISFPTNTALQTAFAQAIIGAATGPTGSLTQGGALTSSFTVDNGGGILTGPAPGTAPTSAFVALAGQGAVFITGNTSPISPSFTTVVAADNSNSSIVNNNPLGGLSAVTGAGGNVLEGLAGANAFTTGTGGQDLVFLNGSSNSLTSNGSDAVLVGGPSTITAAAGGADNVLLTTGTTLAFVNASRSPTVDTITGAANGVVVLAGTGATSIASGTGPEAFFVDTGAGNVTLNGNLQTFDAFTFLKDAATTPGTANITVNNFAAGSAINVHGYAGAEFTIGATAAGGSTLLLTDGSSVTFTNVSAATLAATVKPV